MINKQGLWFLTLTSLILVLSVYYITMPNELLISNNGNYMKNEQDSSPKDVDKTVNVAITQATTIETMQSLKEDERLNLTNELNQKLVNKDLSTEEKNSVYEELKYIAKIESLEEVIRNKIKDEYNLESYVKISDDVVEIVVQNSKHDKNLAVKIMQTAQKEFETQMYISVSFKE